MTRETKIGLVVASSFLCLVGIVVVSRMKEGTPVQAEPSRDDRARVMLTTGSKPAADLPAKKPSFGRAGRGANDKPALKKQPPQPPAPMVTEIVPPPLAIGPTYGSGNHDSASLPQPLPAARQVAPARKQEEAAHNGKGVPASNGKQPNPTVDPVTQALQVQTEMANGTTGGPGENVKQESGTTGIVELDKLPHAPVRVKNPGGSKVVVNGDDSSDIVPPLGPAGKTGDPIKAKPGPAVNGAVAAADSTTGPPILPPPAVVDPKAIVPADRVVSVDNHGNPVGTKANPIPAPASIGRPAPLSQTDNPPRELPPVGAPAVVATRAVAVPVAPAAPRSAAQIVPEVTEIEFETVQAGPADSFASLSEKHYQSKNYADALLRFNRDHPSMVNQPRIQQDPPVLDGAQVFIPDRKVLEQRYAALIPGYQAPESSGQAPMVTRIVPVLPAAGRDVTPVQAQSQVILASATAPPERTYRVQGDGERFYDIARKTLGNPERWQEIYHLNPGIDPALPVPRNTEVRLPPAVAEKAR